MSYSTLQLRTVAVLGLGLFIAACGPTDVPSEKSGATAPAAAPVPVPEQAAPAAAPSSGAADGAVTVRELTLGDRACYMQVENTQGQAREAMAVMELCERRDLIGRKARLSYETGSIAAESCQGDPECTESETVQLVRDVEVLP